MVTTHRTPDVRMRAEDPRRRAALIVLLLIVALALVTVGIGLGRASKADDSRSGVNDGRVTTSTSTDTTDDVPVGWSRTEDGAVGAAVAYLALLNSRGYVTSPETRADVVRAIAVPDQRDRIANQVALDTAPASEGDLFAAAFAADGASAWRYVPVGYRIDGYTDNAAQVSVWGVQITAGTGSANVPATSIWGTTRVSLVWAESTWKLDLRAGTSIAGPTPAIRPGTLSSDLEVIAAHNDFGELDHGLR